MVKVIDPRKDWQEKPFNQFNCPVPKRLSCRSVISFCNKSSIIIVINQSMNLNFILIALFPTRIFTFILEFLQSVRELIFTAFYADTLHN